jgi:hypothetical protein
MFEANDYSSIKTDEHLKFERLHHPHSHVLLGIERPVSHSIFHIMFWVTLKY